MERLQSLSGEIKFLMSLIEAKKQEGGGIRNMNQY